MALPLGADRTKALDLGTEDWTLLCELTSWLASDDEATDYSQLVAAAQKALLSLLDEGLVQVAEVHWASQRYDTVSIARAREIVTDPQSWRTGQDLDKEGSPIAFAYAATEKGDQLYFGGGVAAGLMGNTSDRVDR